MNKYKNVLLKKNEKCKKEENSIEIIDEDTIVIEKAGIFSVLIEVSMKIFTLGIEFIVLNLAFIGLISLVYPEIRVSLFVILREIYKEFLILVK